MDWQGRKLMAGPGPTPYRQPMMANHQRVPQQVSQPQGYGQDLGLRINDLDQRVILTEHANRAALDEVYALRDNIRKEISGSGDLSKQVRTNVDCIAGINVRMRGVEERTDDLIRRADEFQGSINRLEGQFLRNEGDKRLGNDAALREATQARQRVDELSRIMDHQTRITDALSHEMSSMRGRIDLSDLRQRDPSSNTASSTYEKVELKNSFQEGALQGAAQSMIDLKLKEMNNRMNNIELENAEKTAKISALEAENNQIRGELRNMKPNREISIAQPSEGSKRSLENRFEQLVKEVDQCFGELGRQLQRESSARQELTTKLNNSSTAGPSAEIEEKLSKIENSIKEHQKLLYSPGFRAGNFMKVSGDLDLSKLLGELDKINGKCNTHNGRLDDFGTKLRKIDQIEEKFNSDLKMIRARTVTLAEDIENIVANQDHNVAKSDEVEDTRSDFENDHKINTQTERKHEERPKQLRSKSMILEQQMLAESLGELKDNVHVIENQLEEKQTDLNIFKDQQGRLKENIQDNIRTLEQKLNDRIDNILSQPPKMSRTVSLGPDTGDIKKIKADITGLEEKLEHFKSSIKPLVNEFRTGNLMSPAMTALHDQLIQVKSETENLRKISESNRQKSDATSHEVKIRLRTLHDEIERTQNRIDARNSMDTGDEIDVIISVDGKKSQSEPTRQKMINKKLDSLSELEKKQEHFEIVVLKKLDELQKADKNIQPIQQREEKIRQWEYKGEIEDMSSELSKIWKILGDFRIELKRKELIHEDPSNIGALASAINEQMKTGKKGGMKRTQSTDFDFSVDLGQRIEIVEKQINKLSTGKIWKAVEAVEDDQNEIDKRLALVERKLIEVEDQSDVRSSFSASSKKSEKRTKKLKEEVESLKHKTIILENMLTDLRHVNENFEESIKKAKSAATKGELKRLATEVNEIKTKVMEPLTVKCSKMLVEMARKEDMKSIKNQMRSLTEQFEKISDVDAVNIESQLAKVDSSLRKELAKCLTQSDLEEVVDIATSARKSSANVRTELNNFTKRTKSRFEDFSQKVDEIQVKTNEELGNFFKKNTNLGIIKSIDEVRQYSSDLAEKIEIIEEALDEISSKNEELPSISRTSSKLSRLSRSDSRTVLNDVSPFLEDLEGLKSQFADFKDSISKKYVSNLSFSEKSKNYDEAMATVDELKQIKDIFENQSASVRLTKENNSKTMNDVEILTKTVQVLNDLEKVFEKGVEEKFARVFDRLCHIEETTMKKSVHDDVQEMMDIQRTVSQASQINEDSVRLMIKDYVDLEIDNIRSSLKVVEEEVKSQHNFKKAQNDETGESFDINHDLIEAIEGGMREYINGKLDLYVTLAELETAVDTRIERGGPPSVLSQSHENSGAPSREQIVSAVEECVNKQTDQLVSLFVTKDKLLDLQRKIDRITEKKENVTEKIESLRSPSSTSTITSYEVSDKLDSNIRDHIKSQMKHYITTSDMHGLIHEVQRLTESHKMLTDFKYDIHRQIKQDEKKISQLENALLDKSEQRLLSSTIPIADPGISLKLAKLSEKIEDIEDSLKQVAFSNTTSKNENLSSDVQDLKLDFLRLKKHDIFEKINSFVTINDIRGLVVELSTISKDFTEMKENLTAAKINYEYKATNIIEDSSEILDDVENMINIKIEEIWPIVDDIVVKSILEYKPYEKYSDESVRMLAHEEVQKFEPVLESIVESLENSRIQSPLPTSQASTPINLSEESLLELTSKTIVSQAIFNGQQQIIREDYENSMNTELAQVQIELAAIRHKLGQGQPDVVPRPDTEALKMLSDRLQTVETRMGALDVLSQRVHDLESEPIVTERQTFTQNQDSSSDELDIVSQPMNLNSASSHGVEIKIKALEKRLDDAIMPNIEQSLTELKSYFELEIKQMEHKTATLLNEFQTNHQKSDISPQEDIVKLNGPTIVRKDFQDIHRIKGIIDEFELNQFEFQNSMIKKIAEVSDDLSQKIDKVKALTDLSKSLADAENKNFTPEQFSVRNMVYQTERLLKGEISQKVSVLGKTFQSDNFAIRELIREERKKHVRDMNDLTKRQAEVKKEFLDLIVKVNKDRSSTVKASEKCEKKMKIFSSELKQAVKTTRDSLDEVVEAFRDELGQNKIELKNSLKDTIEQSLQGKIAIDRLFARQCKVETSFDRFSREVKGTIKFFTDQLEESE